MVASDPVGTKSAILDWGPQSDVPLWQRGIPFHDVPGDINYAYQGTSHMSSVDELKRNYASLTIQTNPEDTQNAINAINSSNRSLKKWDVAGPNCASVCRDVVNKILGLNSGALSPRGFWTDAYLKYSKAALARNANPTPGKTVMEIPTGKGIDYGKPRYGMNTFDFVWLLLQQHQPKPEATSKFCYIDENGKKVCH